MAYTDNKITTADLNDKGVMGLPKVPGYSTAEMQHKFDEIAKDVIVPHFNDLCDYLNANVPGITLPATPVDGDMLVYDSASSAFVFVQKATTLANLKDVDMTGLVNGMYLRYDFPTRSWKPTSSATSVPALDDINDVSITSAIDGQCLVYNNGTWVNDNEKLDDLKNVYIHLPQDGDVLVYDAANDRWVNASGGIGGGHVIVNASGTELTQRPKMKFKGLLKATDNGTDEITEVSDEAEEISFADWDALTEAQKEAYSAGKRLNILNPPDCNTEITFENLHLAWTNQSPTSNFPSGDITLDTDDYDEFEIWFNVVSGFVLKVSGRKTSEKVMATTQVTTPSSYTTTYSRNITKVSDTKWTLADCSSQASTSSRQTDNSKMIPLFVFTKKDSNTAQITSIATGVSTLAENCMLSDGVTSVEDVLTATTANTKQSLGNISTYTPTKDGYLKVATNNNTSGAYVYIADAASGMVLAVCNGYNANTGCFCSAQVKKNKQYNFYSNASATISAEFLPIE